MGNPSQLLDKLRTNIIGGGVGSTTPIARQTPIELANNSNPMARLDQDPFAFSTLSYPKDVVNNMTSGHYMLFYVNVQNKTAFLYDGYKDGESVQLGGTHIIEKLVTSGKGGTGNRVVHTNDDKILSGGVAVPSTAAQIAKQKGGTFINNEIQTLRKNKQMRRNGIASQNEFDTTTRITDSVAMYLPPNVTDDYGVSYNAAETGLLGLLAATGGGMIGDWKSDDFEGFLKKGMAGLSSVMLESIKKLGIGMLEGITSSEGGVELAGKIFSRAQNPYLEVLFQSPKMRSFTYSFTMAPKNEQEQEECKRIIKLFRFHMAPEVRQEFGRFLTLPAEFDIHYMYQAPGGQAGENPWYNKIATCVLTDCKVDYTPGGVNSHVDGSPVIIKLDLTFMETEMITSDHVEAGF